MNAPGSQPARNPSPFPCHCRCRCHLKASRLEENVSFHNPRVSLRVDRDFCSSGVALGLGYGCDCDCDYGCDYDYDCDGTESHPFDQYVFVCHLIFFGLIFVEAVETQISSGSVDENNPRVTRLLNVEMEMET